MTSSEQPSYAVFSALYAPHTGGVETYTAGIAAELARRGSRVTVVTCQLSNSCPLREVQENGVEIVRLPSLSLMDGRLPLLRRGAAFRREMDALASASFDRVIVNTRFYGLSLVGARFAQSTHTPAVIVEHGSAHLSLGNVALDALVEAYEHRATKRIAACGLPFAAVSQAAAQWLSHFGLTCSGIVPNALDAEEYARAASNRSFREELGISPETLLVAFVGRLVPEKGVSEILKAARLVCAEGGKGGIGLEAEGGASTEAEVKGKYDTGANANANAKANAKAKAKAKAKANAKANANAKAKANAKAEDGAAAYAFAFAGTGPLVQDVRRAAETLPAFALGHLDAPDVAALLREANMLCLPSRSEGFATVLLEAAAMGCMPIVTNVGGAHELGVTFAEETSTGVLLPNMRADSIAQSLLWARTHNDECRSRGKRLAREVRDNHSWSSTADAFDQIFFQLSKGNSR